MCHLKYINKWPHCCNLGKKCFEKSKLFNQMVKCSNLSGCEGFSFNHDSQISDGCFKHKCANPCNPGFGEGNIDYYECEIL